MSVQRLLKTVGIPWTKKGAPLSPWFNPNHCKWWLSCFADVVGAATHCGLTARPSNAAARSYTSLHVHWLIRQFTADDSAKQRRRHFRHRAETDARTHARSIASCNQCNALQNRRSTNYHQHSAGDKTTQRRSNYHHTIIDCLMHALLGCHCTLRYFNPPIVKLLLSATGPE